MNSFLSDIKGEFDITLLSNSNIDFFFNLNRNRRNIYSVLLVHHTLIVLHKWKKHDTSDTDKKCISN